MSHRLAALAPVGTLLFTLAWLVLGAISPGYELFGHRVEPYSWLSQPVSGLGLGVTGPWMNGAFIVGGMLLATGVLSTAGFWWQRGRSGPAALVLLSLLGIGMIVCGVFTLESMMLHLAGFLLAVPLPAVGMLIAGVSLRRDLSRLSRVSFAGGAFTLILFAVFMATFEPTVAGGNEGISGLVQRVLILGVTTVVSVIAIAVPGRQRRPDAFVQTGSGPVVA